MSYIMIHYYASPLENVSVPLTHTARVSNVHFRVHILLCFYNAVLVINITGLLVFHNFLCLKNNFEHVLTTTLVRMTELCQRFEMFLDSTGCGPLWQEWKFIKVWRSTERALRVDRLQPPLYDLL